MDPTDLPPDPAATPTPASPEAPDTRLFLEITPKNILSFGPDTAPIELRNLNVLIGPNGSGKSNLIDVLSIFTWIGTKLSRAFSDGVDRWRWNGPHGLAEARPVVSARLCCDQRNLLHSFTFTGEVQGVRLVQEGILVAEGEAYDVRYMFAEQHGASLFSKNGGESRLPLDDRDVFDTSQSILSQRRDPQNYPEITLLSDSYRQIALYRDYTFGRRAAIHQPQRADQFSGRLEWDGSNLALVVSHLLSDPKAKRRLLDALADLYDGLSDINVRVQAGSAEISFTEGDKSVPATRLSDGSLRYLWLLAILLDPDPPPFIAIEEPELGLHPDLIPKVADLLVDASTRTQLLVTTHSDILIDALSEHPEYVLTCEKHDGQTEIKRLDPDRLKAWLKDYGLGNLWISGHLGGKRW